VMGTDFNHCKGSLVILARVVVLQLESEVGVLKLLPVV
jgi:hypothetical protein